MRNVLVTILFTLCLFLQSVAQTPPTDELGCASKEGEKLSFLVGNWKVKSKCRRGKTWEETTGTANFKFLFDDCLLPEKLSVKRDGKPLTVLAMYPYNNFTKSYQWMFAHSEHGLMSLFEGGLKEDKFTLENSLDLGGRRILFRRLLSKKEKGFELIAKRSFDQGKTWRVDWYLDYYR